jgi:predicted RNA-binding Zn-ribbon protein involved in translation (DUF1610 family)
VDKAHLLDQLTATGRVPLACLTVEEMACINADEDTPFRPAEAPERLSSLPEGTRGAVLTTALRSLVARGLVQAPGDEEIGQAAAGGTVALRPLGELDSILGVRRAPTAVVFVGQASYLAALHGFREERVSGFLEERVDPRGLHYFTLLTTERAVEAAAGLAGPGLRLPAAGPAMSEPGQELPAEIAHALRGFGPGVTRLDAYHARPAGTRRIRASILVRDQAVHVLWSAFGVAPDKPRFFTVNADGLRQVLKDALCDPAGEPHGSTQPGSAESGPAEPGSAQPTGAGPPFRCPVCGYLGLDEAPWTEESGASYEICPSCGFEFGVTDVDRGISYEQRRREWIAAGMRWWSRRRPPPGWDPRVQLRELTGEPS